MVATVELDLDEHAVLLAHIGSAGSIGVVRLTADMTAETASALRTQLIDALGSKGPRLVVSLRGIRAADTAGVDAVEAASSRAWRRGGWLRLIELPPAVLDAYTAAGLHPDLYDGLEDAVRAR